jgi:hypothetical protein
MVGLVGEVFGKCVRIEETKRGHEGVFTYRCLADN